MIIFCAVLNNIELVFPAGGLNLADDYILFMFVIFSSTPLFEVKNDEVVDDDETATVIMTGLKYSPPF